MRVDALERASADAVVVTPAHQHPTGAVLAAERRAALLALAARARRDRDRGRLRRGDTATTAPRSARSRASSPTASSTPARRARSLAPALRLGWLVVPPRLLDARRATRSCSPTGHRADRAARVRRLPRARRARPPPAPHARPLPRAARRAHRRARRARCPRPRCTASPAGCTRRSSCPTATTSRRSAAEAAPPPDRASAPCATTAPRATTARPTLMLGYAQLPEPAIRAGVRELAEAIRAARGRA